MNMSRIIGTIVITLILFTINDLINYHVFYKPQFERLQMAAKQTPVMTVQNAPFIEPIVPVIDPQEVECMAMNIYWEARNQKTKKAMAAVGFVVMNRVASKDYGDSACEVIYHGRKDSKGNYKRNQCHFSWVCDGLSDTPALSNKIEIRAWNTANDIAIAILSGTMENPIGNAIMYHANYVNPDWAPAYEKVIAIKDHIFYEKV